MPNPDFAPARFQTFAPLTSPTTVAARLKALRAAIAAAGLDGFLVPRADAHRGESVPAGEARLAYVTSFTGSAGLAVVGPKKAGLFVDSRYTLQAPLETDTKLVTVLESAQVGTDPRIADFVPRGGKLGFDPWLHTPGEIKDLGDRLAGKATLVPSANLVDRIWDDRPPPPVTPVEFLGHNRAGRTAQDKLAELRRTLAEERADVVVLTLPESINWLFNMRGRDVPNVPVVLGFALVPQKGQPTLFVDKAKITPELRKGLSGIARVADKATLMAELRKLGAADKRVWLDPATAPLAVVSAIKGVSDAVLIEKRDPVLLPKSRKNDAEIGGMKEAHKLDGIALAKFLAWFDAEAPRGRLTEIGIVEALEDFRREEPSCVDASFDTISGAGPNGAIVHYSVDERSNRTLRPGELMLLDSGAQYLSGTTDITRTLFTGKASAEHKDRFTRVLKGMIALSMQRFPRGTSGAQLDVLARQFLWQDGIAYNHGTGHGVGAFLGVHEGPIGFSTRYPQPLEPGQIISNEPGYYKAGGYGIRIENLVLVVESAVGDGKFLELETLTLCPIDLRLIDDTLLLPHERDWLNAYHKRVWREIGPSLKGDVKAWLKEATRAI
ncbi:MAG: X-Pro aminopeptidase [Devosia sp. 67-54]|uniref:aminopeptidase P family protein n=1 Tax=unclassified Devosia TaxID=196773 RepID=UPI00096521B5|nr:MULTISPECIES: aminopeptidase P family protein [unclassified Devosia]MBN9303918.1 aminopeptidase P family protein [Devosia sp.]OJX17765.1 MAG: X-Pro aminopeptidase [Devosia sp. 67-54]